MFKNRKLIKDVLEGIKDDFAWIEIKWQDEYNHYMHTINYINNKYVVDSKNVDHKEIKKIIKNAVKSNKDVKLIKMK